jgi:hypothetical protein
MMMPVRRAIPLLLAAVPLLAARAAAQEDAGRLVQTPAGYELRVREQDGIEYSITLPSPAAARRPEDPIPGRSAALATAADGVPSIDVAATADPAFQAALERLALHADDPKVRQAATITLARTAAPGVGARLERIHRRSTDPMVRRTALRLFPLSPDRRRAIAYLATVATGEADASEAYDGATAAVWILAGMGTPGAEALRALHASGAVRSRKAAAVLDQLARTGFRAPQPE